ncbi:long-chain acyl-CoA synthetase [Malonomonas rubra DSM 5091]|uniref:Long-chain acyl-CoA synthetase n=1 Tax=Malonomonas rubra DSM 5091 TaxID=1122189 RepID=A0A1M6I9G7_MALRU|nr:AMP-dependent synthetase/ligase [Malonomonas rubra]SHJ31023.1 long-chain acyl-CoA synthetase [Malonomonas rubra DSM 5091]
MQVARIRQQGDGDQLATLVYTSGTTGPPKGAMLTHDNILCNVEECCSRFDVTAGDQCLSFLPLSHIFERTTGYYLMLRQGATIAYAESIDSVAINLAEIRPTVLISVPRLYEKMHNRVLERVTTGPWLKKQLFFFALILGRSKVRRSQKGLRASPLLNLSLKLFDRLIFSKIKARLGGRLRILISGGAPLSAEIAEFFLAAEVPIYQGCGMTETSPVIAVNYPDRNRIDSVGPPLPQVELKIADDRELLVKGRSVFHGYWRETGENSALQEGGWFRTGDLAKLDDDRFLFITGRKKELIVTAGGKNVAPQEIENELKTDKFISNLVVYGDNKPYLIALVVPDFVSLQKYANYKHLDVLDQKTLLNNPQALDLIRRRITTLQQHRPSYQQIKRFTLLARDFSSDKSEVTQTLKLKRKIIADNFAEVIEDLYRTKSEAIHKTCFCSIGEEKSAVENP